MRRRKLRLGAEMSVVLCALLLAEALLLKVGAAQWLGLLEFLHLWR